MAEYYEQQLAAARKELADLKAARKQQRGEEGLSLSEYKEFYPTEAEEIEHFGQLIKEFEHAAAKIGEFAQAKQVWQVAIYDTRSFPARWRKAYTIDAAWVEWVSQWGESEGYKLEAELKPEQVPLADLRYGQVGQQDDVFFLQSEV